MEKTKLIDIEVTETKVGEFFYRVSEEEYRQIMDEGKDLFEVITDRDRINDIINVQRIDALNDYDVDSDLEFKVIKRG